MTETEYDCLNGIRYAMKLHLRWDWDMSREETESVFAAMDYLEDTLWEHVRTVVIT